MNAARMVREVMGLNRTLLLCGVSKKSWYCAPSPRNVSPDPQVQEMIRKIGPTRSTYGTRRMAAQVSRELNHPVNRKAVRRMFRRPGWSKPSRTKREIIRANKKPPRPNAPNRFWESDMSYVWCGTDGWGYCFNVIDVFTRQWPAFVLAGRATRRHAIMAVNNAVAAANPVLPGPTIWSTTDPVRQPRIQVIGGRAEHHPRIHLRQYAGAERAHRVLPHLCIQFPACGAATCFAANRGMCEPVIFN